MIVGKLSLGRQNVDVEQVQHKGSTGYTTGYIIEYSFGLSTGYSMLQHILYKIFIKESCSVCFDLADSILMRIPLLIRSPWAVASRE